MRRFYPLSTTLLLTAAVLVGCDQSSPDAATTPATESTMASQTVEFANAKCPIMGGKPTTELTAKYQGQTIGFCCDGCPQKWAELSDEERAEKFAKVSHDAAGNKADHEGHEDNDHGDHS